MSRDVMTLSAEPNVTPMIDVLLVLLIVFMVLLPRLRQDIRAQLPAPPSGSIADGPPPLVLPVAPGPRYELNRQPVARGALRRTLVEAFATRPEKVLFVAGDTGVTYQDVVSAMDMARGAGVRVLAISPRPRRIDGQRAASATLAGTPSGPGR